MKYPKIYLSIDTCFASKRWTRPEEWAQIIHSLGVKYIEASADNECDPLYTPNSYLKKWSQDVLRACEKFNVTVATLYSGHGTYSTLGLTHTSPLVQEHIQNKWIKPFLETARQLEAFVGFYCHAFPNEVLQSSKKYNLNSDNLCKTIQSLVLWNKSKNGKPFSVEQMYTPHQYPWTLATTHDFIQNTGSYITLDTGHQTGQQRFIKPSKKEIITACHSSSHSIWLGPLVNYHILQQAQNMELPIENACNQILENIKENPQLFAEEKDGDLYAWLREFGCYSPIIHLQQTNGTTSSHLPFYLNGSPSDKVHGRKVLESIYESYQNPALKINPCQDIYLTLELFFGTNAFPSEILHAMEESVSYWRQFIPKDGMPLDQLLMKKDSQN